MLVFADADHQRAAVAGGDDHVGIFVKEDRQSVCTLQLRHCAADGRHERLVPIGRAIAIVAAMRQFFGQAISDQMCHDLGIGGGLELVSDTDQIFLQCAIVLDHTVMNDGQIVPPAVVRMGVSVGRLRRAWPNACGRCRCAPRQVRPPGSRSNDRAGRPPWPA